LYYWLAGAGLHPFYAVRTRGGPPPPMGMNMPIGKIVGVCRAEAGNARGPNHRPGFYGPTSPAIFPDHPRQHSVPPPLCVEPPP
ncbi:nitrate/bicarbonate ABC transporter substrate-binding protein, partial [Cronobacter sakazakii]